ncbi:DUF3500 domain-containing protein [Adhaeribacter pallidiroseus]|uniref:DUF3500 domain-containing protein n=1 Tax=Adhaeribacter pallidiroseus TaxID=2072847 RepID=A0A369QMD2_9BACT|nr:DUF3500 domain-containing protein [Adhaeribacter pallidiroseus]RDC64376.1 hypothetical protein AHMF7616_02989 [Adhaeribacter pallidiroseus]
MARFCLLIGLLFQISFGWAQTMATTKKTTLAAPQNKAMLRAVKTFMSSLTEEQRKKASYPFTDEERFNWHFVPRDRKGVPLKEMTAEQQKKALAILQTSLSEKGYQKAKAIMELEVVLKALEKHPPENTYRDPGKYYFSVFGEPTEQEPWAFRVEGHHLSLNFSSVTGRLVAETPAFMGSNPAIVPEGPEKGKQILKEEANLGFALVQSFTPEQLKKALINEKAPNEIVTSNSRKAMLEKPEGILFSEMNAAQQKTFTQLLNVYLGKYNPELATDLRAKVEKAGFAKTYFAWAGSQTQEVGKAHYYRIHNPVLLIEYDNSQNNANHVHTVVRDLTNDFGEDALQAHYKIHPHE